MVRINLIPKEEKVRGRPGGMPRPTIKMPTGIENYVGIIVLVLVIAVLGFLHIRQRRTIGRLQVNIEETRRELRKLDEVVKLVKELDKKRKDLDARIEIIRGLNRGRYEKAKLMYKLSYLLPDYCWLQNLEVKGTSIAIKGITFSNQVISDLMRKLQNDRTFTAVELKNIVGKDIDKHSVMEFDLMTGISSVSDSPGGTPSAQGGKPKKGTIK
jgi:type IV pilus assembly protein PilN